MQNSHTTLNTGILGLGIIGRIWANHFHTDRKLAAAWNRTPQQDCPNWKNSPAAVAENARNIIICVADPAAVEETLTQILPSLTPQHLIIQSSTIDPQSSSSFRLKIEACGAQYIEAPFTGSRPAAENRQNIFYLGGTAANVERAEAVLSSIAQKCFHIGTNAQAATLKLAMNLQLACQAEALCESLAFCRSAGIEDSTFFDALRPNAAWSGLTTLKEPKLRDNDFSPQFSVKHMSKDLRLAIKSLNQQKAPALRAVYQQLSILENNGFGDEDFIALIRQL